MLLLALELDPLAFPCDGPVFGIPHGLNVLTNLPFLVVGVWALWRLRGTRAPGRLDAAGLWLSTALLCFGSGLYHLFLTPFTLMLDRACIAGIMAFFAAWSLSMTLGWTPDVRRSLLLLAGAEATVVVWLLGGTSLAYGGVQAVGGLVVLVLFVRAWRAGRLAGGRVGAVGLFLLLYGLAKLTEVFDPSLCDATGFLGGHPLKHLLAAAGLLVLVPMTTAGGARRAAGPVVAQ